MVCQRSRISKNLFISCVISLAVLTFISNNCFAYSEPGDSADNPINIESVKDLETIAQDVNEGQNYLFKHIKLNKDIIISDNKHGDLTDTIWESIGNKNKSFDGTFDGNGHTISCNINGFYKDSTNSLFGTLGKNGSIKNLNVLGHISSDNANSTCAICYLNYGTIENCSINVDINSSGSVGEVAVDNYGTIDQCFNYGKLSTENTSCSGVAINNYGIIKNCYVAASLQNTEKISISKICGIALYNYSKITDCLVVCNINNVFSSLSQDNDIPIFSNENMACGISCVNNGEIDNCSYIGDLSSNVAGGISVQNNGIINNCGTSSNIKGIIAGSLVAINNENGEIKNSYCVTNIYSNYYAGKISAINMSTNKFDTCFCESNIYKLK